MTMSLAAAPPAVTVIRQTTSGRLALTLAALALLTVAVMPWWASTGTIRSVLVLCCYIAIAQMWNLLAGYAGLVSVGQQAFMGAGGYALFVLAQTVGINPFVSVALALVVPVILAVPVYLLLHRLEGPYFSIGTWVVAEVFRLVCTNLPLVNGGAGMSLRVMGTYSAFERNVAMSILCAVMLLVTLGGSYWLLRSRFGIALVAIRDNMTAAASQGVDVARLRFLVFVAAAAGCGLVGAVYFMAQLRITPGAAFDPMWANVAIFIVMIGGIGSIEGVLIGALVFFLAERWFASYGSVYFVALGLLTLATALFAPKGIWGLVSQRWDMSWFPTGRRLANPLRS